MSEVLSAYFDGEKIFIVRLTQKCALSVMPVDLFAKIHLYERTEFIAAVIRNRSAPNLLAARGCLWNWERDFGEVSFLDVGEILAMVKNFFREDMSEVISAYFDGEKIFIARLTQKIETLEVEADGLEIEHLAEKISLACKQKGWKTSSIGFCLRQEEVVTFQTEISNVPEKEIPELVKSWAVAQAGANAKFSFTRLGEELWMETLPKSKVEEYLSAFKKFDMNLCALSVMPTDLFAKIHPYERTEFIAAVVRNKSAPNLLATRGSLWNWEKISKVAAAIFLIALTASSLKLFLDYKTTSDKLDAAKISVENLSEELALKQNLDEVIAELHKINELSAQVPTNHNFNLLLNLGKIASEDIRLTRIRVEENFMELEGVTEDSEALKNYLGRVKNIVVPSARLESSSGQDDKIYFVIRATLK